ncbi:MAG: ABC transporter ATP-binding protein [Phycisphaerales bacterium]|nr:ABC transporter ATP-binding protein [Planctomycetota bacterium]
MLLLRDLHKWYGDFHALRGVSFSASRGQVVGLLGPNGAGKTTSIRIITGVFPPTSGTVEVANTPVLTRPEEARRHIGYLPESAPLYPEMSVEGYLHYRARLFGFARGEARALIGRALEIGSLDAVRRKRISTLSKGFRQRVGLAAAALHRPGLLVLDEPANGLDPTQIKQMRETIRALASESCVLLSSHILGEVELTCDRVVIIASGTLLADGTPAELRARHAPESAVWVEVAEHEATAALIAIRSASGILGAESVKAENGFRLLRARTRPPAATGEDPLTAAARSLHDVGIVPRTFAPDAPSLERVFHSLLEASAVRTKDAAA